MFRQRRLNPRGTYTDWSWAEKGFSSLEHVLVPEIDPGPDTTYFWAHQFRTENGEGGYIGLQTKGNRVDGSLGKMAIFSFWNTLGADGPAYQRFGGEGEGWSCRIPYYWEAGQAYRLAVQVVDEDAGTIVWGAFVEGEEFGRILAPAQWGRMGAWSIMWTEYYGGPLARCEDLPYSKVRFSTPVADGRARPHRSHDHLGDGHCNTSRVTHVGDDVRHEMGLPSG
ncbi:MAG: DUF3472 domain-containing protein [Acidimicrobiales bacterium]